MTTIDKCIKTNPKLNNWKLTLGQEKVQRTQISPWLKNGIELVYFYASLKEEK